MPKKGEYDANTPFLNNTINIRVFTKKRMTQRVEELYFEKTLKYFEKNFKNYLISKL